MSSRYVRFWTSATDEDVVRRLDDPSATYGEDRAMRWDEDFSIAGRPPGPHDNGEELVCGVVLDG